MLDLINQTEKSQHFLMQDHKIKHIKSKIREVPRNVDEAHRPIYKCIEQRNIKSMKQFSFIEDLNVYKF